MEAIHSLIHKVHSSTSNKAVAAPPSIIPPHRVIHPSHPSTLTLLGHRTPSTTRPPRPTNRSSHEAGTVTPAGPPARLTRHAPAGHARITRAGTALIGGGRGSRRLVAPPSPIAGAAMEARPARPTRRHTHPPRCRASHWITRLPPLAGHLLGCISHRVVCVASCRESTQPSCSLLSLTSPALSLPACDWTATAAR